ncbi:uncharacterized protein LOC131952860 [Physella acuta]|uniref:uncharacterized protein LOC131952860 n=1 Tax=Physella acuta TaxID=109671 RepID=UPI0027DD734A|nr:uncharacterized protein LOC131952860 [Physella acuta]
MLVRECGTFAFIPEATRTGDVLAEMIMPLETFGKEFISIYTIGRESQGDVEVYSSEPDTVVTSISPSGRQVESRIQESWTRKTLFMAGAYYFYSTKPIYAMYYMDTACQTSDRQRTLEVGDPAMCNIIPINLFYDGYVWSTPFSDRVAPVNYVCLIVKTRDKEHLRMDDLEVPATMQWVTVNGAPYELGNVQVAPGTHNVYGVRTINFGCYIYGLAMFYSYMNPAGFIAATINAQCTPAYNKNDPGDLIDNDCDQRIDEEIKDGIDNDNDNRIDEDLANPPRANGAWSEWQEWACILACHVFRDTRLRLCDNPAPANNGRDCEGNPVEYRDSDCGRNVICPTDCPEGQWDFNCVKRCEHCEEDCNKFLGNCTSCKPGFINPEHSCDTVCPPFTYGKNCEGNCMEKCEAECLDKVNGNCPPKTNNYLHLLWFTLLIPCVCLLLYYIRRRRSKAAEAAEDGPGAGAAGSRAGSSAGESKATGSVADTGTTSSIGESTV